MMSEITKEDFVIQAIKRLRDDSRSKGIHSVYSGFNEAFRLKFSEDPRVITDQMVAAGKLVVQPRKGGVMLYIAGEEPKQPTGQSALDKILG